MNFLPYSTTHNKLQLLLPVCVFLFAVLFSSCDETYTPKPRGYFRIELPEKSYTTYVPGNCPFTFDIPAYSAVVNYHDSIQQPCWKYIRFPQFNGEVFFSYKPVQNNLATYLEDSRALAYK